MAPHPLSINNRISIDSDFGTLHSHNNHRLSPSPISNRIPLQIENDYITTANSTPAADWIVFTLDTNEVISLNRRLLKTSGTAVWYTKNWNIRFNVEPGANGVQLEDASTQTSDVEIEDQTVQNGDEENLSTDPETPNETTSAEIETIDDAQVTILTVKLTELIEPEMEIELSNGEILQFCTEELLQFGSIFFQMDSGIMVNLQVDYNCREILRKTGRYFKCGTKRQVKRRKIALLEVSSEEEEEEEEKEENQQNPESATPSPTSKLLLLTEELEATYSTSSTLQEITIPRVLLAKPEFLELNFNEQIVQLDETLRTMLQQSSRGVLWISGSNVLKIQLGEVEAEVETEIPEKEDSNNAQL